MSEYYVGVDENGQAYLAHHGIKGQKWGVRRYQNDDGTLTSAGRKRYASNLTRLLNKADQQTAEAMTRKERAAYKKTRSEQKLKRHIDSGKADPLSSKTKKLTEKVVKSRKEYSDAKKAVEHGESLMWKMIADANEKGYSVNSSHVIRMSSTGQKILTSMGALGTVPAWALYSSDKKKYGSDAGAGYVQGARYRVYDPAPGEKQKIVLSTYT